MDFELVDTGSKRDICGRRIETRAERERLMATYDESGLTQRAFAKREGVAYSTLAYWLKQRRQRRTADAPKADKVFHEVTMPSSSATSLEVCLPDGMVLRGGDAASLAALVKALQC